MFVNACGRCGHAFTSNVGATVDSCPGCAADSGAQTCAPGAPGLQQFQSIALSDAFSARYQLGALLGSGASGVVFRAKDRQNDRVVALKFLTRLDLDEALRRFRREARVLANLQHPNVVRIYDMDEVDGFPYLVLELLGGGTLRARLVPERPLSPDVAIPIILSCLDGLAACHDRGILHRDIKPENILFQDDGTAKLSDLGLATASEPADHFTRTGMIVGTLRYMAPEQFVGTDLGPATDLFAIGLVLLEMLLGRPACCARSALDYARWHSEGLPELLRQSRGQLPEPLFGALSSTLAYVPADRPPSASALAERIREAAGELAIGSYGAQRLWQVSLSPARRLVEHLQELARSSEASLAPARRTNRLALTALALGCLASVWFFRVPARIPTIQKDSSVAAHVDSFVQQVASGKPTAALFEEACRLGLSTRGLPVEVRCAFLQAVKALCRPRTEGPHPDSEVLLRWVRSARTQWPDDWMAIVLALELATEPVEDRATQAFKAIRLMEGELDRGTEASAANVQRIWLSLQLCTLVGVDHGLKKSVWLDQIRHILSGITPEVAAEHRTQMPDLLGAVIRRYLADVQAASKELRREVDTLRKQDPAEVLVTAADGAPPSKHLKLILGRADTPGIRRVRAVVSHNTPGVIDLLRVSKKFPLGRFALLKLARTVAYLEQMAKVLSEKTLEQKLATALADWATVATETWAAAYIAAVDSAHGRHFHFNAQRLAGAVTRFEERCNPERERLSAVDLHAWMSLNFELLEVCREVKSVHIYQKRHQLVEHHLNDLSADGYGARCRQRWKIQYERETGTVTPATDADSLDDL